MATHDAHHNAVPPQDVEKDVHTSGADHYNGANGAQVGQNTYSRQAGPFSRVADYRNMTEGEAQAFGGSLQPGLWKPYEHRKFANPAPLGLSAFALTTFVLSCVNLHARGVTAPNIAVPLAFGYGGLVQLLAGMWYVQNFPPMFSYFFFSVPGSPKLPQHLISTVSTMSPASGSSGAPMWSMDALLCAGVDLELDTQAWGTRGSLVHRMLACVHD